MRIVMMGTGPFAVPTFRRLIESSHDLVCLVTRPVPKPKGRRKATATSANPMQDVAESAGIDVYRPLSVNDEETIGMLNEIAADLFVVCDYGQILSNEALATARLGGINLHASLLPKYRGAAPINWALFAGESETGITVIHMTPKLDAGPNLIQTRTAVGPDEDAVVLESRLAELGVNAVNEAIEMLENWNGVEALGTLQDNASATRAPRLKKRDGTIDWSRTARQIFDQVRAFKPWPGSFTDWCRPNKPPLRLLVGEVECETQPIDGPPGSVVQLDNDRLVVACGQGNLQLKTLQPAGKKVLGAAEFLRGYPIKLGDRFGI